MSSSHRQEPWKLTYDDGGTENPALRDREGTIIADIYGNGNGRRIVACINACAGISTDGLEFAAASGLKHIAEATFEQRMDRNHLLGLLRRAESFIAGFEGDYGVDAIDELLTEIRTAIAEDSL